MDMPRAHTLLALPAPEEHGSPCSSLATRPLLPALATLCARRSLRPALRSLRSPLLALAALTLPCIEPPAREGVASDISRNPSCGNSCGASPMNSVMTNGSDLGAMSMIERE